MEVSASSSSNSSILLLRALTIFTFYCGYLIGRAGSLIKKYEEILKNIKIESKGGFEFAEELLIKAYFKGYKVCEVPTVWIDRTFGKSKFKLFKWLPKYAYWYLWGIGKRLNLH